MHKIFKILIVLVVLGIVFFQIKKMNEKIKTNEQKVLAQKAAASPFVYLLDKKPVYKDKFYKIYITNINDTNKIVYLKEGALTEIQKESKFFLHIYPKNKRLLGENKNGNLSFDFREAPSSFLFRNKKYYFFEKNLPNITIEKINTGQYGYKGDNSVHWKIKSILRNESMQKVFRFNNDRISLEKVNKR